MSQLNRQLLARAAPALLPGGLSAIAFLLLALSGFGWHGLVAASLALAAGWVVDFRPSLGAHIPARVLLAAGMIGYAARETTGPRWPVVVGSAMLLGLLLSERLVRRLARPWYRAAHLPVRPGLPAAMVGNGTGWLVNSALIVAFGVSAALAWPAWTLLPPALAAGLLITGLTADGVARWRTGHRGELAALARAVEAHRPSFLLYFSAPPGSEYQARMWLPQLERIGQPFLVVLPESHSLPAIAAATQAPVVMHRSFEALDAVLVPSLRVAFYVNNGMRNAHCVRFTRLTHIQLYHGDSDKAVTASPVNAIYDRIFVAGQAAIDRFAAHGVELPQEKFRIVGRPQVEALHTVPEAGKPAINPTVLYAPTWVGAHADSDYCSLRIAEPIVSALLARGATVILRPHPYTRQHRGSAARLGRVEQLLTQDRDCTGRAHRWGRASTDELSLFDCMNRSHAMICDVSSLASDYLHTGKPFAITDMAGRGARFAEAFPLARAGYRVDRDARNLDPVLIDLLDRDPLSATRRELRTYYLGDIPPGRYAEAFQLEARSCLAEPLGSLV